MKVLVTGAGGQLAWELQRSIPEHHQVFFCSRSELNICDEEKVANFVSSNNIEAVINAAAYTAVDKAESESDRAKSVNELGSKNLANVCAKYESRLLHISTDFVFNGQNHLPYSPEHLRDPLGVYGQTKAAGEIAIEQSALNDWAIIRTAWVYSSHGANFVKTMLRLMNDKPELNIVSDQIGTPTWAKGLAQTCWHALDNKLQGIHHWTDDGVCSWYDFAMAIKRLGLDFGLIKKDIEIKPIPARKYPTPAARPHFSVLDKSSILEAIPENKARHWQDQLSDMLKELN